jgi:hypothetical protein
MNATEKNYSAIDASCRVPLLPLLGGAAIWLVVGLALELLASLTFHMPWKFGDCPMMTYGRVQPAANDAILYGFAIPAALAVRKLRAPVAALILLPPLLDWADRRPPLDPARYVAARLLDDAAYSLGVWQGCLARRTARPLLPVIGGKRPPG